MSDILVQADHITRRFGGLTAVNDVSLTLQRGQVHAVIGTNGAGKSTLVHVLSGEIAPTSGSIHLGGRDVTRATQPDRARAGLGRSYQRTTIFPQFTVFENARLSAQGNHQRFWNWWTKASTCPDSTAIAADALRLAGLDTVADRPAGLLSHGQKRQLEIAMCLALRPKVLLLDEPLAGMGAEETERMLALLQSLKAEHAILLVEHDMDAVFRVSDVITVMVNGSVIAKGTPEAIRNDPLVQTAYLGETPEGSHPDPKKVDPLHVDAPHAGSSRVGETHGNASSATASHTVPSAAGQGAPSAIPPVPPHALQH